MFDGPPDDAPGKCNARLKISDDYGDNSATMLCRLDPGHEGPHREEFQRGGKPVVVTWFCDDSEDEIPIQPGDPLDVEERSHNQFASGLVDMEDTARFDEDTPTDGKEGGPCQGSQP